MRTSAARQCDTSAINAALHTIELERAALHSLANAMSTTGLGAAFEAAVELMVGSSGRIVVTGMGKSGLVGRKIAATLASTGTPSLFLHPAEASHGDLGMIARDDVVLALSWSGETAELADILAYCARFRIPLVAVTSEAGSSLGTRADVRLLLPKVLEACPNNLAPTSSTTLQATIGDALAVATITSRGFTPEDFRILHPKGRLGAKLLTVGDVMARHERLPRVLPDATMLEATLEMSAKRFGITAIVGEDGRLLGAFSDGDLRRNIAGVDMDTPVADIMSTSPVRVESELLASEALAVMNDRQISQLFICDDGMLTGIIHVHDILRAGVA